MKKVLFVAKVVRSHIMTFHVPYLKLFKDMGWETAVAAHNDYDNPEDCVIPYCDTYFDVPFERFPLSPSNATSYREMKKIIDAGDYDIIHCHTPVSAMITRLAALGARKRGTKVIYTAHGFHFFKGAPLINWLLYFPVEWALARFTDALITINKEDYARAQKFAAKRVYYVPGVGIDTKKFAVDEETKRAKQEKIRTELGIPDTATVLLSVGEVNENKNHRVVIEALAKLKATDVHYIICGRGELEESHKALANQLGLNGRVHLTGYRNDVADLFQAADIFVFPSLREGLPVAVMEAMASGLPIICNDTRGCADLIENNVNGIKLMECNSDIYASAISTCLDQNVCKRVANVNRQKAVAFDLNVIVDQYKLIYHEM